MTEFLLYESCGIKIFDLIIKLKNIRKSCENMREKGNKKKSTSNLSR